MYLLKFRQHLGENLPALLQEQNYNYYTRKVSIEVK